MARGWMTSELTDVASMTVLFMLFMVFVVLHDKNIDSTHSWTIVDTVYFWIVSFTTVGFGDIHFSLEVTFFA